jgi:hypothetical protein
MNIKLFVSGLGVDLQRGCNCVCITANRSDDKPGMDDYESIWLIRQRWIDTRLAERGRFMVIKNIILI